MSRFTTIQMSSTSDTVITASPEETFESGRRLGAALQPGDVVALMGELGSGKTCFIQGVCAGLDIDEGVVSPTFTLINEYRGKHPVSHFDLYRLDDIESVLDIGYDEYLDDNRICLIEWADKFPALIPPDAITVRLDILDHDRRRIRIKQG